MIVTSITPSISVEKQNDIAGMNVYINYGESVIVTETSGNTTKGTLFDFVLGLDEEEDDILVIKTESGDHRQIGVSYIIDIDSI